MRKLCKAIAAISIFSVTGIAAELPPHVSVVGTATTEVVPDEMHWTLNVITRGQQVASVAELHDNKVASVVAFLKDHGIEEKKIQTSRISLSENWVYRDRTRVKEGYTGSTTVTFESNDLDKYRDLWMGLANLKDVSVNGVGFDSSERIQHQRATRIRAVQDARQKAGDLAGALDAAIGAPLLISEDPPPFNGPRPTMMRSAAAFEAATPAPDGPSISPGTISITTRVAVKFLLL